MRKVPLPILGGGHLEIDGPTDANRWILFICRDNFRRDDPLAARLARYFRPRGFAVARYEARIAETGRLIDRPWLHGVPLRVRLVLKGLFLLTRPTRWAHFLPSYRRRMESVANRTAALRELFRHLGSDLETHVIARSAGGRMTSLVADEAGLRSLVCLSYPFQNPKEGPNPARTAHLPTLRTPFLILQGTRDPYGGLEAAGRYPLAPSTQLEWVDTDHGYALPEAAWPPILARIHTFLEAASARPPHR